MFPLFMLGSLAAFMTFLMWDHVRRDV